MTIQRASLSVTATDALSKESSTWDFDIADLAEPICAEFARAFAVATSSSAGTLRRHSSFLGAYRAIRDFAKVLTQLEGAAPTTSSQLHSSHLAAARSGFDARKFGVLRTVLRRNLTAWNDEFATSLFGRGKTRESAELRSYSPEELTDILTHARKVLRGARDRIRPNRLLLDDWRSGRFDDAEDQREWLRGNILDEVATTADVPRYAASPKKTERQPHRWELRRGGFRSATEAMHSLFLTYEEAIAGMILLVGLTGQNASTLSRLSVTNHLTTGPTDAKPLTIVDLVKPRRRHAATMTVALEDIPAWLEPGASRESQDLRTPFGVYSLLAELCQTAREASQSSALLCWFSSRGGTQAGRTSRGIRIGLNPKTPASDLVRQAPINPATQKAWNIEFARIRLTFVQEKDEPVAHTPETLRDSYQAPNRAALKHHQRVVADVLAAQVRHAKATLRLAFLSADEVREAMADPDAAAARYGVRTAVLEQVIAGKLDTVLAACSDHENGPYNPGPCRASFLLCLECPCAIALPSHWPAWVAAHDQLAEVRQSMTEASWAARYGKPAARLEDLLSRMPAGAVDRAREQVDDTIVGLVKRMLAGELDET